MFQESGYHTPNLGTITFSSFKPLTLSKIEKYIFFSKKKRQRKIIVWYLAFFVNPKRPILFSLILFWVIEIIFMYLDSGNTYKVFICWIYLPIPRYLIGNWSIRDNIKNLFWLPQNWKFTTNVPEKTISKRTTQTEALCVNKK